jgi:hypothetical protein
MVLAKKENKQAMDKLQVFSPKTRDNFRVWPRSVKTYFRYQSKKFTVDVDKIHWLGGRVEGKALFWHQSHQEHFEKSHCRDTCAQYEEALCERFLNAESDKQDLERLFALRYEGDIEDYMTQMTYYKTKLGLKSPAWVAQIALGLLS